MIKKFLTFGIVSFFCLFSFQVSADGVIKNENDQEIACSVYFSGIGCSHCAKSDPLVLDKIFKNNKNLVVIDYEVYRSQSNAPLMRKYDDVYDVGLGIPLLLFNQDNSIVGDKEIKSKFSNLIKDNKVNKCLLPSGEEEYFKNIDLNSVDGEPKFWVKDRVLIRESGGLDNTKLHELLLANNEDLPFILDSISYTKIDELKEDISGGKINFENAVRINGWVFKWNGGGVQKINNNIGEALSDIEEIGNTNIENNNINNKDFTIAKIMSLAVVDAVNPCAFAVLLLMLTTILTYNPKDKRNLILSGLAFIISIFVMYLFYGLVIIKFMKLVEVITSTRVWIYNIFGLLALILGILNIKDFFNYKPGSVGTEMPLFMRPKVKGIIERITSPVGAFLVGIFVTLFLLPCTIGPYVICCGLLSMQNILDSLPSLLLYNFIFVLPMFFILLFVVIGFRKVDDIAEWKANNIHKMHLFAGIVMFLLGISMLFNLI